MNKRSILTAVIAAFLALPLAVTAADKKKGGGFAALDTNGDGKVSKEEFTAAMSKSGKMNEEQIGKRFASMDKDGNGSISAEEFAAGQKSGGGKKKKSEN